VSDNQYADIIDEENDVETPEQENGPKALRDHAKKLEKEVAELRKFKAEQEASVRDSAVKSKLAAAGLPEAVAKFAAGAEDIDAWINENRGLFGGAGTPQEQEVESDTPKGESSLGEEAQAEIQAFQNTPRGAYDGRDARTSRLDGATEGATSFDDAINKINAALKTPRG